MCGSSRRMSTTSTIGQPARSCRPRRGEQRAGAQGLERRARRGHHARDAGPAGALERHVPGVPRRGLLLLVGLVVLVDDHDRGQAADRRPGRRPGADHRGPGRALRPVAGMAGDAHAGPPQGPGDPGRRGARSGTGPARAPAGGGQRHRRRVGRRGQPQHRPAPAQGVLGQAVDRPSPGARATARPPPARPGAGRPRSARATRCAGTTPGGPPSATPPTGPARSGRARGRARTTAPAAAASTPAGGSTPTLDDPPADAARPEGDADPVPDAHLAPERVGDQVVERLVDGGLVGRAPARPARRVSGSLTRGAAPPPGRLTDPAPT